MIKPIILLLSIKTKEIKRRIKLFTQTIEMDLKCFKTHYFVYSDFIKSSFLFGHFIETQKFAIYTAIQIVHIA